MTTTAVTPEAPALTADATRRLTADRAGGRAPAPAFLRDRPWRLALVKGAIAYVLSRLVVLAAAGLVAAADAYRSIVNTQEGVVGGSPRPLSASKFVTQMLTSWDGLWYMLIARKGYPRHVVNPVTYYDNDARAAFFPGFPMLVRAVNRVVPGGDTAAALLLNVLLGGLFILLVGLLARRFGGNRLAGRVIQHRGALIPQDVMTDLVLSK